MGEGQFSQILPEIRAKILLNMHKKTRISLGPMRVMVRAN